ncbi:DUF4139 domain-containing protein [Paracoccus sp. p4-l81]|uniref:DUF4139 domain-containing protein n=1 Tax=Paracoccus sp. p4-l81 TaxID=3342806 RepID=UPI0035B9583B
MRALLLITAALILPLPMLADSFDAQSRVSAVTLYPWGASVTRQAEVTLPKGSHEIVLTDLPQGTDAASLRVQMPGGVTLGAVNLQSGRLPPETGPVPPALQAARDAVSAAEAGLAEAQVRIDRVLLKARAAQEQIAFLRGLSQAGADDPIALSRQVGAEALVALEAAQTAEAEARALEPARKDAEDALADAQQALAALTDGMGAKAALTLVVQADQDGPVPVQVTSFTADASWQPVYDLRLTRLTGTPGLTLDRGVLIAQSTGEDWLGVDLVLSTARPSDRATPSVLDPQLVRADDPVVYDAAAEVAMAAPAPMEMARMGHVAEAAQIDMQGATVTWRYGNAVDIRTGVENLRLRLDSAPITHSLIAEAVPLADPSAYLVADTVNDSGQMLLPGPASLFVDGAMVGQQAIPLTPPGEDLKLGFGPIDGLVLERIVAEKSGGERGLLSSANRQVEQVTIRIRNQTNEDWPLRVIDRVPYSEQDDLKVSFSADPAPSTVDYDDRRGLLAWDLTLPKGAAQDISLTTTLDWPQGKVLN